MSTKVKQIVYIISIMINCYYCWYLFICTVYRESERVCMWFNRLDYTTLFSHNVCKKAFKHMSTSLITSMMIIVVKNGFIKNNRNI